MAHSHDEERRVLMGRLAVRAAENEPSRLIGYAAVFNTRTEIGDVAAWGFYEQIVPGAFRNALTQDVRALLNHDPNMVLGRTTNGTLSLAEDETGLRVEITPPDTQTGRDVLALVQRGDISQMSFAFRALKESWEEKKGEPPIRTLEEVDLFDVSPVTYPAYPTTSVQARSASVAHRHRGESPDRLLAQLSLDEVE